MPLINVMYWLIVNYGLNNTMRFWNQMKPAVTLAFYFLFFSFSQRKSPSFWLDSKQLACGRCAYDMMNMESNMRIVDVECILTWRQLMSKWSTNWEKQSGVKNVEALGCVFYQGPFNDPACLAVHKSRRETDSENEGGGSQIWILK